VHPTRAIAIIVTPKVRISVSSSILACGTVTTVSLADHTLKRLRMFVAENRAGEPNLVG